MPNAYEYPKFDYIQSDEQKNDKIKRHCVVIIGAGPVGLTAALDFAVQGIKSIILDDNNTVSIGSRAVCYAKRPLEIWDKLGCAAPMVDKGVAWNVGKVFRDDEEIYKFDLLPEDDHKMPAFINLQQYYLEEYLVNRCGDFSDLIEIRWKSKVISLKNIGDFAILQVETPDGIYQIQSDWMVVCDGANSDSRNMMGLDFTGKFFQDRFLIADVIMKADFPPERWFWFNPPFHRGQSVLLHKQPENIWRIDFQLGWDCDPEEEKKHENVIPRLQEMLGKDVDFELEWVSVYQFACRRMENFRHGNVFFAGDSAHQVSPFGARGANTGVQDIDNLGWKLKLVVDGKAPESLLDSYNEERAFAADDNILNSTRSTDFISPKSEISKAFRDATLDLAKDYQFARPMVNSGRLSLPTPYIDSSLNTKDSDEFNSDISVGCNCPDAPIIKNGDDIWLLNILSGQFKILVFGDIAGDISLNMDNITYDVIVIGKDIIDEKGILTKRYDGKDGTVYLIRPDQHIAGRWRQFDRDKIYNAIMRATGNSPVGEI